VSEAVPAAQPLLEGEVAFTVALSAAISAALSLLVALTLSQVPKSFGHGEWLPRDGFIGCSRIHIHKLPTLN